MWLQENSSFLLALQQEGREAQNDGKGNKGVKAEEVVLRCLEKMMQSGVLGCQRLSSLQFQAEFL